MSYETIVAVFDSAAHAAGAVSDLIAAGVPESNISQHRQDAVSAGSYATTEHKQGFWASLFGGEPEHAHDTTVYDQSLAAGGVVVTVKTMAENIDSVMDILDRHSPVDVDDRAASFGTAATSTAAPVTGDDTIQLSEEQLVVGKRAVNRGTTRVRRYVVEVPVSEQVALREENVTIERRPVTGTTVDGTAHGAFTDKVIEMTEMGEEAVVGKTTRVVEEVVLRKGVNERTETVTDTVRREDVEVTTDNAGTGTVKNPAPLV